MNRLRFSHALAAALLFSSAGVVAQQPNIESQQLRAESEQFQARLDEAARALGNNPRLKKVSEQKRQQLVEFVVGNMLFTLLHESAHGLVNQMELPVLGKEEDAADAFATVTMLKVGTALSHGVLVEASKAWFLTDRRDRKEGTPTEAYDAHGLDEQRAYQIVCLMVGSNKQEFKDLADQTNLPDDRQDSCWNDYASASWSWDKVLQPHRRTPEQPSQQIEVTYFPGKGDFDVYERTFRSIGMLEIVANHFAGTYAWPHPIGLEMASCGEVNAAWNPQERKVVLCYELAQDFAQLFRDYGQEWEAPPKYKWWQLKRWKRVKRTP
jgi:hypothetical protein